jgi:hypothetical protein
MMMPAGILLLAVSGVSHSQQSPYTFPSVTTLPVRANTAFPDPFLMQNGSRVKTCADWETQRKYLREMLLYYEYGRMPPPPGNVTAQVTATAPVFGGVGEQRSITLAFGPSTNLLHMTGTYTFPKGKSGPLPVAVTSSGCSAKDIAMNRGFIIAEINVKDLAPDVPDPSRSAPAFQAYPTYDWGTIGAWAWGYHRAVDYLLTLPEVNKDRVIYTGYSRWGKTTLCAGMTDDRAAIVNPHQSGTGGCASGWVSRPGVRFETLTSLTTNYGYQFTQRFVECAGNENKMPFDQHFAKAVIAPRAFLDTEAMVGTPDTWLNAYGSFQTNYAVQRVYDFLGASGQLAGHHFDEVHIHSPTDWTALFDFADHVFDGKPLPTGFLGGTYPEDPSLIPWTAPSPVACGPGDAGVGGAQDSGTPAMNTPEAGAGASDTAADGSGDANGNPGAGNTPVPDGAGVPDAEGQDSGSASGEASTGGSGAAVPGTPAHSNGSGCACGVARHAGAYGLAWVPALAALLAWTRRRRGPWRAMLCHLAHSTRAAVRPHTRPLR